MENSAFVPTVEAAWVWLFFTVLVLGGLTGLALFIKKKSYRQPYSSAKPPGEPDLPDERTQVHQISRRKKVS